jgi:hypothetical protein
MRGSRIACLWVLGLALGVGWGFLAVGVADADEAPLDGSPPSITGTAIDGAHLRAAKGAWTGQKPITYAYRWLRCDSSGAGCVEIASAAKASYRAGHEDVGRTLRIRVTASNGLGELSATSDPTATLATAVPAKRKAPKITGNLADGQLLTAGNGTWKGTPPESFSYKWELCTKARTCSAIAGATASTYRVLSSQIGEQLRVIVSATNAAGTASATSSATKKITPGPPLSTAPPTISGSLQEGETLSADAGSWVGTAPIEFAYQWRRCTILGGGCEDISGATGATYTATGADLTSQLLVVVTASNAQGASSAASSQTQPILGILPTNTALPSISGLLQDGQLLGASAGTWSGTEPISYTYQWQLCNASGGACSNIEEALGSTLKLSPAYVGSTLRLVVTATNVAGSASVTSAATGLIGALLPSNISVPSISGVLQDGQLLSVGTGTWSGTEPISYGYEWQLCNALGKACKEIPGATGSSLKLDPSEIGSTLAVVVTATNAAGSSSVTSSVSGLISGILPKNSGLPSISGLLQDGQLLSAATGTWSGTEPISYTYHWQLCNASGGACNNIEEAVGSTLKLSPADVGSTLRLVVTATNIAGSTSVASAATGLISAVLPSNTSLPSISGLLQSGQLLSASTGTWSGTAPIAYSYQWQLCNVLGGGCSSIAKATESALKLSLGDVGLTLRVVVTAGNAAGSSSATSTATGLILGLL